MDCVRETVPPFSPEAVVQDYAALLATYRVVKVTGDRYAGEWPREQFRKCGVEYLVSERTKSDLYRDRLPLLNSQGVELLDYGKSLAQLLHLERRTGRGGRDQIDHAPRQGDDLINAVAGAVVTASGQTHRLSPESTVSALRTAGLGRSFSWGHFGSHMPGDVPVPNESDEMEIYRADGSVESWTGH